MKVITNRVPRPMLSFCDLSMNERTDMIDTYGQEDAETGKYFIYKEHTYSLSEFQTTLKTPWGDFPELRAAGWDGVLGTSYFDAIVIKVNESEDTVTVGRMIQE